jgi:hypothetical protein
MKKPYKRSFWSATASLSLCFLFGATAYAHGVAEGDKGYIQEITGVHVLPFMYLGAKHMFTGYDHILFLLGVIFFLYRLKDIGVYVSLFALGHSTTMLLGVYFGTNISCRGRAAITTELCRQYAFAFIPSCVTSDASRSTMSRIP